MNGYRNANQALFRALAEPKSILVLLTASVVLNTINSDCYELVKKYLGDDVSWIALRLIGSLATFFVLFPAAIVGLGRVIRRKTPPPTTSKRPPAGRSGLIFLVSQDEPCRKAIDYHLAKGTLRHCWLICSKETLDLAQSLRESYERRGAVLHAPLVVNDVNDPEEYRDIILKVYETLPEGLSPSDVITDYLGMTSHATAGVVLAWSHVGFPIQYTLPIYDANRRRVGVADPIEIVLGPAGSVRPAKND